MVYLCEERCVLALCKPQFEYADILKKNHSVNAAGHSIDKRSAEDDFNGVITDLHIVQNIMQTLCIDLIDEGKQALLRQRDKKKQKKLFCIL
jgi:hypothetical protein